ncbi:MAG TPA: ATP-dependent DNA helicase RecG [Candidatus Xenobia bacterium]|nr:ATP-dependent DNA helicase RecG [Candidatus Xenobia bacterium]
MDLSTPLTYVKGVGPARAAMFEAKGLRVVEDLLFYPPFRYEDRTNVKTIRQLAPGEMATVLATVRSTRLAGFQRRNLGLFEATFTDSSAAVLAAKWFHGAYLNDVLSPGQKVALFGKVEFDSYSRTLSMMHPEFEILSGEEDGDASLHTGRVVPVYEAVGKITTRALRTLTHRILEALPPLDDPLPACILQRLKLPDRWTSIRALHFPPPGADLRTLNAFRSAAQYRLIFEEFFWLECGLELKRAKARLYPGIAFQLTDRVRERIKEMLPFKPTGAQKRVLGEIARDMAEAHPMYRLLQGDVGSGKTLVAAEAAVIAIENGYQVAVLAPTEILATQHFLSFKKMFQKLGYTTVQLVGSLSAREKKQLKKLIAAGLAHVVVGTHALLEEDVVFARLGLAVVDEQHRFGVEQRQALLEKGSHPDVLVMTATPIPRTLALALYSDLDMSVLDELPPGRTPVTTRWVKENAAAGVWEFIRKQVAAGRQAYIVYPVIDESKAELKAATKEYERLSRDVFQKQKVGLLHGRLKGEEKERVMREFAAGKVQVLVATSVVEVGVDVPNATVMVIEHAERFGLSQLHQLRGRIGRGRHASTCVLMTPNEVGPEAEERLQTLVATQDGFKIAELDLKLRGPGEFVGTRQHGFVGLRIANLLRDHEWLERAKRDAFDFVAGEPPGFEATVEYLRQLWQRRYRMADVA